MKIIAVTSCPIGMAHTYMASAALKKAAKKAGVEIKVETQGSMGIRDKITTEDIKEAAKENRMDEAREKQKELDDILFYLG